MGHVVNRSQSSDADVKLEGKIDANTIRLDPVDRSDGVVVGATERVVKTPIVCRVPKEQRDGARDAKTNRKRTVATDFGRDSWR